MTWRIEWTERALKDAERLDRQMRERIISALDRLATAGQGDVKRLRGYDREWRLRVGDWRARFTYHYDSGVILVLRVLPRGSAYRE